MKIYTKPITKKTGVYQILVGFQWDLSVNRYGHWTLNLKYQKQFVSYPITTTFFVIILFGVYILFLSLPIVCVVYHLFIFISSISPYVLKKQQICLNSFHIFHFLFVLFALLHFSPPYDWTFHTFLESCCNDQYRRSMFMVIL